MPRMDSVVIGQTLAEKCPRQYRICIFCFLSAPNSPKTKSGANGKFLPNPSFSICDIRIQKQMSRSFAKSFPKKIVFAKLRPHCSATRLNTWKAEPQRKMSFPFSKEISPPPNQESKEHFSLVLPREAR